jgi:hypothetical protein
MSSPTRCRALHVPVDIALLFETFESLVQGSAGHPPAGAPVQLMQDRQRETVFTQL